jgi:hypothetical protein
LRIKFGRLDLTGVTSPHEEDSVKMRALGNHQIGCWCEEAQDGVGLFTQQPCLLGDVV